MSHRHDLFDFFLVRFNQRQIKWMVNIVCLLLMSTCPSICPIWMQYDQIDYAAAVPYQAAATHTRLVLSCLEMLLHMFICPDQFSISFCQMRMNLNGLWPSFSLSLLIHWTFPQSTMTLECLLIDACKVFAALRASTLWNIGFGFFFLFPIASCAIQPTNECYAVQCSVLAHSERIPPFSIMDSWKWHRSVRSYGDGAWARLKWSPIMHDKPRYIVVLHVCRCVCGYYRATDWGYLH